jgi:hypothetical protein
VVDADVVAELVSDDVGRDISVDPRVLPWHRRHTGPPAVGRGEDELDDVVTRDIDPGRRQCCIPPGHVGAATGIAVVDRVRPENAAADRSLAERLGRVVVGQRAGAAEVRPGCRLDDGRWQRDVAEIDEDDRQVQRPRCAGRARQHARRRNDVHAGDVDGRSRLRPSHSHVRFAQRLGLFAREREPHATVLRLQPVPVLGLHLPEDVRMPDEQRSPERNLLRRGRGGRGPQRQDQAEGAECNEGASAERAHKQGSCGRSGRFVLNPPGRPRAFWYQTLQKFQYFHTENSSTTEYLAGIDHACTRRLGRRFRGTGQARRGRARCRAGRVGLR